MWQNFKKKKKKKKRVNSQPQDARPPVIKEDVKALDNFTER